ncbi:MAG: hypothetical protein ABIH23_21025 [bacterium]
MGRTGIPADHWIPAFAGMTGMVGGTGMLVRRESGVWRLFDGFAAGFIPNRCLRSTMLFACG